MNHELRNRLDAYQKLARTTAAYPVPVLPVSGSVGTELPWVYPVLGLQSEIGELEEAASPNQKGEIDYERIHKELGDVCWYVADIATVLGLPMSRLALMQEIIPPGAFTRPEQFAGSLRRITIAGGIIAGICKKDLRDSAGANLKVPCSEHHLRWCEEQLAVILCHVASLASSLCFVDKVTDLYTVLDANIAKLKSRKERGVLGGSGDDR